VITVAIIINMDNVMQRRRRESRDLSSEKKEESTVAAMIPPKKRRREFVSVDDNSATHPDIDKVSGSLYTVFLIVQK